MVMDSENQILQLTLWEVTEGLDLYHKLFDNLLTEYEYNLISYFEYVKYRSLILD